MPEPRGVERPTLEDILGVNRWGRMSGVNVDECQAPGVGGLRERVLRLKFE